MYFLFLRLNYTLFKHLSIKNIYIKSLKVIYDKSNFVYSWFYNSLALMTQTLANLWATFRKTKLLNLCTVYAKTSYRLYVSISHACCPTTGYVCPRLSYSIKLRYSLCMTLRFFQADIKVQETLKPVPNKYATIIL